MGAPHAPDSSASILSPDSAAVRIQSFVRMSVARQHLHSTKVARESAAVTIQASVRIAVAKKQLCSMTEAAKCIQKHARQFLLAGAKTPSNVEASHFYS